MHTQKRATFGGKISAILVAAGSSVGLGNIWRFPYVAGDNGGGAFLLIYILCVLLLGVPIMISEFAVGRGTRLNAVGAYALLGRRWKLLGYNSIVTVVLILGFYFVVAGWTLEYAMQSITGGIAEFNSPEANRALFDSFTSGIWRPILYTCLFVLATHAIIALGVQKGIERSAKLLMPLLLLMLAGMAIHALTMPGAREGLEFLFKPDFSKVTGTTVLIALGQAFFSLSIGQGTMVVYASYFKKEINLRHTAANVTILDTTVAILAGIVIFPAVFSAGIAPSSGPSLVFITLPSIFNDMAWGGLLSAAFFLLLVVAALTSTISLHEVLTAYLHEEWHLRRNSAAWITTIGLCMIASLASLSLGVLNGWRIFGLSLFDAFDFASANIFLPIGGLFTSLFVGWKMNPQMFDAQLTNDGALPFRIRPVLIFLLRWICPAVLLLLFFDNLGFI